MNSSKLIRLFCGSLFLIPLFIQLAEAQDEGRGGRRFGRGFGGPFPPGMSVPTPPDGQPAPSTGAPAVPPPGAQPGAGAPAAKTRPDKPQTPADPKELEIRPNEEGLIQPNFRGQPWLDVLEWVAKISNCSLDWQEHPGDFLNLQTHRPYTVPEVRDLINRHLLDRGYSMLQEGEVISVVNLKKVDPSMVPRVKPEDLDKLMPHEFVKVSFALDWMIADEAVNEFRPMLSPNGNIWALKSTNRVEVMDSVANIRPLWRVLQEEQSTRGQDRLVRQFKMKHTRAIDVLDLLYGILGIEKKKEEDTPKNPQEAMMRQQQEMMRMQMMQQRGGMPDSSRQQSNITLVVNSRENSILASAPPDRMAAIEKAIEIIDVPSAAAQLKDAAIFRMQTYHLTGVDPAVLVKTVEGMGILNPTTQLEVDEKNKAIIANADFEDHQRLKTLVDQLDGTGRQFNVRPLRRLQADYVAGSIEFVMGAPKKEDSSNRRRYYDWYGYGGGGTSEEKDPSKEFRVEADIEYNRLLLYANDVEMKQVDDLLEKLGEIVPRGSNKRVRVIENLTPEETEILKERLKKSWPQRGNNPLLDRSGRNRNSEPTGGEPPPKEEPKQEKPASTGNAVTSKTLRSKTLLQGTSKVKLLAAAFEAESETTQSEAGIPSAEESTSTETPEADEPSAEQEQPPGTPLPRRRFPQADGNLPEAEPDPILFGTDSSGNLVITSDDTDALDLLEELIEEIRPPRKDWKQFVLKNKNSSPYWICYNLEKFFEAQNPSKDDSDNGGYYYWDPPPAKEEESRRLSTRKKLTFIDDIDTNSIIVVGADSSQLAQIEELINLWDQPESPESRTVRITKVFQIKYSEAKTISAALKDVYRDLLSVNDPALQANNNKERQGGGGTGTSINYNYNRGNESKDEKPPQEPPIRFKGLISLGVDEISNSLIVSTSEGMMGFMEQTIKELDDAARPMSPKVEVVKLNPDLDIAALQEKLNKIFGKQLNNNQQNQQNNQQRGNRGPNNGQNPPNVENGEVIESVSQ